MIVICLLLAILAALLLPAPPKARLIREQLRLAGETVEVAPGPPASRRWRPWVGLGMGLGALWLTALLTGARGTVSAAAVLIMLATCVRLVRQQLRTRAASQARIEVAHACSALASRIRVGRVPAEALRSAAADCPVLVHASRAQKLGGDVTNVWRKWSTRPGYGGLADLARAWQVSTETGAPLAQSLDQVSEALTADQALRSVVEGELAAPRATGKIMAVLPFCGLGLGYLLGGDPLTFLMSGPYGWLCLVLGVALAASGVLWIDWLAHQATGPG
jgi:tight adherence protein B